MLYVVLQAHMISENHCISTTRVPLATNLSRMITYLAGLFLNLWSCGLARSSDKLKQLYLYYYSGYGHQTWQVSDLT